MNKTRIGTAFGSLVAGVAASGLGLLASGIVAMVMLSRASASDATFQTGEFLQTANPWTFAIMALMDIGTSWACWKHRRR